MMMKHVKGLHTVTFTLVMVGGLNWLVFALFNWEVGDLFGGMHSTIAKIIYILVGLSAVYEIGTHGWRCRECKPDGMMPK
jgi:uncharacterized membrane protein YuzA (DUF378 family)